MARSDIVASTLEELLSEGVADQNFFPTDLLSALAKSGGIRKGSGYGIRQTVFLGKHTSPTAITDGAEVVNTSYNRLGNLLRWDFARVLQPIILEGKQLAEISGKNAIMNFAKEMRSEVISDLSASVEQAILIGTGPASGTGLIETLNGGRGGWLEAVDFGDGVNTVGSVVKSDFKEVFQNHWLDGSGGFSRFKLDVAIAKTKAYRGGAGKHAFFVTPACQASINSFLSSSEQYVSVAGRNSLGGEPVGYYAKIPIYLAHALAPDGEATEYSSGVDLSGYLLDLAELGMPYLEGGNFEVQDVGIMDNADQHQMRVIYNGQLGTKSLRSHCILTDCETPA